MSRGDFDFLKKVAKKKPELQKILDTYHDMTIEEIEKLPQPAWVRNLLVKSKNRMDEYIRLAQIMSNLKIIEIPKQEDTTLYKTYIYKDAAFFMNTGKMSLMLEPDSLIQLLPDNRVRFENLIGMVDSKVWLNLPYQSVYFGDYTEMQYKIECRKYINSKYNNLEPDQTGPSWGLNQAGIKQYRIR